MFFTPSMMLHMYSNDQHNGVNCLLAQTRVFFTPSMMYDGPSADRHLNAFATQLKGRGATVTLGTMRMEGLPEGFI